MKFLYNNTKLADRRQELRKKHTAPEALLWARLRNRQINSAKFFRQYSVGPYVLDFYCSRLRLAIELDGVQHLENVAYDNKRTHYLSGLNITVIRFWNSDVLNNLEGVVERIIEVIDFLER